MRLSVRVAVALAVAVSAACSPGGPQAIDFEDPLTGPVSPAFVIPFSSYALTPAGLERSTSPSGTENGIDRPIIKTASGAYLSRDFVFEIDVKIPAEHGDIAFVGFGAAEADLTFNNEPTKSVLFRIHNLPSLDFFGIDIAISDAKGQKGPQGHFRELDRIAVYHPGESMRFRITHQAGNITLAIPTIPGANRTFKTDDLRELFGQGAFIFLANSSQGTTFRNASLKRP